MALTQKAKEKARLLILTLENDAGFYKRYTGGTLPYASSRRQMIWEFCQKLEPKNSSGTNAEMLEQMRRYFDDSYNLPKAHFVESADAEHRHAPTQDLYKDDPGVYQPVKANDPKPLPPAPRERYSPMTCKRADTIAYAIGTVFYTPGKRSDFTYLVGKPGANYREIAGYIVERTNVPAEDYEAICQVVLNLCRKLGFNDPDIPAQFAVPYMDWDRTSVDGYNAAMAELRKLRSNQPSWQAIPWPEMKEPEGQFPAGAGKSGKDLIIKPVAFSERHPKLAGGKIDPQRETITLDDGREMTLDEYVNLETTEKETTMSAIKIQTITYVNGTDVSKLTNEQIYDAIQKQEAEIGHLSAIKNKPKALKKQLEDMQKGIDDLVALVDQRDGGDTKPAPVVPQGMGVTAG